MFPKLPEDHTKRSLGVEPLCLSAGLSRHNSDFGVSTTIVLPTYSVWPGLDADHNAL
jgi:hypothetical protein